MQTIVLNGFNVVQMKIYYYNKVHAACNIIPHEYFGVVIPSRF